MYLDHFTLKSKPFALSTDPRFLWAGANQRQALATLSYGLEENRGIIVLNGEFGTGKTTLVNAFVKSLNDSITFVILPEPGTDPAQFRLDVAEGFGFLEEDLDREGLTGIFVRRAGDQPGYNRRRLLIIDEAHGLTAEMQEDVLGLARLECQGERLLHILLAGQNEMYQWATGATGNALLNQVSATCRLTPLNEQETAQYIEMRLRVAGAVRPIFEEEAVNAIHAFSQGVPRVINLMCDFTLLHAYTKGADRVDGEMVGVCKDRFQIATHHDAHLPEVTTRDLTTLPAEQPPSNPNKLWRSLGFAAPMLLLALIAFWYYSAANPAKSRQGVVNSATSPETESSLPSEQITALETAQKAATIQFTKPPSKTDQEPLLKAQRPPATAAEAPDPTVLSARDQEAIEKAGGNQLPTGQPETTPSVAPEPLPPTPLPLDQPADPVDAQGSVPPLTAASKPPIQADPGDIIEWLLQKKQKGGDSATPSGEEVGPSSE